MLIIATKNAMDRAFKLSSNWFHEECNRLKTLFLQLAYPEHLVNSTITKFVASKPTPAPPTKSTSEKPVRIILPFKEQKSADTVRKQLKNVSNQINIDIVPVFIS